MPKVIFHCALSRARGPYAARQYAQALASSVADKSDPDGHKQEVLVLTDGFNNWSRQYKVGLPSHNSLLRERS